MKIPAPIMKASHKVGKWFIKHGPRLMSVSGGVMAVGGAVMACKATLHADEVLDAHKARMAEIEAAQSVAGPDEYTPQMIRRDKAIVYAETAVAFAKLYGPSVAVGAAGVGLMQGAFGIMDKRNSTAMAALTALDQAYNELAARFPQDEATTNLPSGVEMVERPKHFEVKHEDDDDVDTVLLKDYIPVEEFDILENDPFTIVFDSKNEDWYKGNAFVLNSSHIKSTMHAFELKRSTYHDVWVNDIRRAFNVPEAARGWSNGYSTEIGDSVLYDVIPCIYDKVDGMIVGAHPIFAEPGDPLYESLGDGLKERVELFDNDNERRLEVLKSLELDGYDDYFVVIRLLGSGPNGEPAYIRGKVFG